MATSVGMFCPHKRLRTACTDCTPTLRPPSALVEDDSPRIYRRRA